MAIHIKNMKEMNKALQSVMIGMVDKMAERIYETLNYSLQEYYDSYDPVYYRRYLGEPRITRWAKYRK